MIPDPKETPFRWKFPPSPRQRLESGDTTLNPVERHQALLERFNYADRILERNSTLENRHAAIEAQEALLDFQFSDESPWAHPEHDLHQDWVHWRARQEKASRDKAYAEWIKAPLDQFLGTTPALISAPIISDQIAPAEERTSIDMLTAAKIGPVVIEMPFCEIWVITCDRDEDVLFGTGRYSKQIDLSFSIEGARERLLTIAGLWPETIERLEMRNPSVTLMELLELVEVQTGVRYEIEPYETVIARENLSFLQ